MKFSPYDPRGSVAGLADAEGHLTKTYRYEVTGELTYGSATYENEYTYNGESYNPNIQSQYLRARYYNVVTANFLTEDSYLGNINQPLTLNRYNYCISSYLNYVDPSGNGIKEILDDLWEDIKETASNAMDTIESVGKKAHSFTSGVGGSLLRGVLIKPSEIFYPFALQEKWMRHIGVNVPDVFTGGFKISRLLWRKYFGF